MGVNKATDTPTVPRLGKNFLNKELSVPKCAISAHYGKRFRGAHVRDLCYHVWVDGGRPHEVRYAAAFVCPITGEVFVAGKWLCQNGKEHYVLRKEKAVDGTTIEVAWYCECYAS